MAYFTPCSSASIINFEHVMAGWKFHWITLDSSLFKDKKYALFNNLPGNG